MKLYKHKNNKDVAVEVLRRFYIKEKDAYAFKFCWWNIGSHEPWDMKLTQRFKIPRKVWEQDWSLYETGK